MWHLVLALLMTLPQGLSASQRALVAGEDIRNSIYCLTHGSNPLLSNPTSGEFEVYFARDRTSYVKENHFLIFTPRGAASFDAFDIEIAGLAKPEYRIENSATIRKSKTGGQFVTTPLGGIWTHNYFMRGFSKAMRAGVVRFSAVAGTRITPICRSYAEPVARPIPRR